MQVNNQLADFGIDKKGNAQKLTQAKIMRHMPQGGYDQSINQFNDGQSMNSEAFSQFSLPTHMNGLKVNVGQNSNIIQSQARAYDRNLDMMQMQPSEMDSSSQFSSQVRSNNTINQQMVNLGAPSTVPGMMCQSNYDNQPVSSYHQTEDSFQSAEQNAFDQEQKAKMRRQEKELKLQEFQNKTKANASIRAKKEKLEKVSEADAKKAAAIEKQLKVKEYAKKQKELLNKKKDKNTRMPQDNSGSASNKDLGKSNSHHDIVSSIVNIENRNIENSQSYAIPKSTQQNISYEPIAEVSEENVSQTQQSSQKGQRMSMQQEYMMKQQQRQSNMPAAQPKIPALLQQSPIEEKKQQELAPLTNMMKVYSQIDQGELEKLGFEHKSEFTNEQGGLKAIHQYSILQRFRGGRAFNAVDKFKVQDKALQESIKVQEEQFWRKNVQSERQKKEETQARTERARYLSALKALVKDKGSKMGDARGENNNIPPLCSCGAQVENIKSVKQGAKEPATALCASNCQFYKNEKGYVKALRDVLHSIQQLQQ